MPSPRLLHARPEANNDRLICWDEPRNCGIYCDGTVSILAIEPVCAFLEGTLRNNFGRNIRLNEHCDYIIIGVKSDEGQIIVFLVEMDPYHRHNTDELGRKMQTCENIARSLMREILHGLFDDLPRDGSRRLSCKFVKVVVHQRIHQAGKSLKFKQKLVEIYGQDIIVIDCYSIIWQAWENWRRLQFR